MCKKLCFSPRKLIWRDHEESRVKGLVVIWANQFLFWGLKLSPRQPLENSPRGADHSATQVHSWPTRRRPPWAPASLPVCTGAPARGVAGQLDLGGLRAEQKGNCLFRRAPNRQVGVLCDCSRAEGHFPKTFDLKRISSFSTSLKTSHPAKTGAAQIRWEAVSVARTRSSPPRTRLC